MSIFADGSRSFGLIVKDDERSPFSTRNSQNSQYGTARAARLIFPKKFQSAKESAHSFEGRSSVRPVGAKKRPVVCCIYLPCVINVSFRILNEACQHLKRAILTLGIIFKC
jgi:hypothetical protein